MWVMGRSWYGMVAVTWRLRISTLTSFRELKRERRGGEGGREEEAKERGSEGVFIQ